MACRCAAEPLRESPLLRARIDGVRAFRESSGREQTRKLAAVPALFGEIRQPTSTYLLIPKVSSDVTPLYPNRLRGAGGHRQWQRADHSRCNTLSLWRPILRNAQRLDALRGRSHEERLPVPRTSIVYNNYPWPASPTVKQKEAVEIAAQKVLDVRTQFVATVGQSSGLPSGLPVKGASGSPSKAARAGTRPAATPPAAVLAGTPEARPATLADLYDPLSMPPALVKAHAELDRAVDLCYRPQPFTSERQRVEYLFGLYEQLTAPLLPAAKPKRAARKKASMPAAPRPCAPQPYGRSGGCSRAAHPYREEDHAAYRKSRMGRRDSADR